MKWHIRPEKPGECVKQIGVFVSCKLEMLRQGDGVHNPKTPLEIPRLDM